MSNQVVGKKRGSPLLAIPSLTDQDIKRFWSKSADCPNGCREWNAYRNSNGYGIFGIERKTYLSHRVSYFLRHGLLGNYDLVCHKCDNPACVNPEHLFIGDDLSNVQDMIKKGRRYTGEHTLIANEIVSQIREMYNIGGYSGPELAAYFGVSSSHIYNILHGKCRNLAPIKTRKTIGEDHPGSKLDAAKVIKIKQLYAFGITQQRIADLYGVNRKTISQIVNGKTWNQWQQMPEKST